MPTETFHGREIFLYSQAKEYSVTLKLVCTQATTRKQLIGWPPGASQVVENWTKNCFKTEREVRGEEEKLTS